MDGYDHNLTTKLENSRNSLRRIARNNDTEFSKESVLNAMDKFVKTVTAMEETVLVPRRLVDLDLGAGGAGDAPFSLFSLLNELKTDLLWASKGVSEEPRAGRFRRPTSSPSASSCGDSDSEVASIADSDSGVEAEDALDGSTEAQRAAAACRRHLRGLRRSLHRLTAAAADVTRRYQDDVGGPA